MPVFGVDADVGVCVLVMIFSRSQFGGFSENKSKRSCARPLTGVMSGNSDWLAATTIGKDLN